MTATVFVWDMLGRGPDGTRGVGHASLHISGRYGAVYISFWPSAHTASAGWSSPGKIHFMNGDRLADGMPQWASKPLDDLDEAAIIRWWGTIQRAPLIDYSNKQAFQKTADKDVAFAPSDARYRLINHQCSTMVLSALWTGANATRRLSMLAWLASHGVQIGAVELPVWTRLAGSASPTDVRRLVAATWGDPLE